MNKKMKRIRIQLFIGTLVILASVLTLYSVFTAHGGEQKMKNITILPEAALPALDKIKPARIETATFALG